MKLKRHLLISLSAILLMIVFALSPFATPIWISLASQFVDGLKIDNPSGSLFADLRADTVRFSGQGIDLSVSEFHINHQWTCLLSREACIETLSAQHISLTVAASGSDSSSESSAAQRVVLPVAVTLNELLVKHFTVNLPDKTALALDDLFIRGKAKDSAIELTTLSVSALDIALAVTQSNGAATSEPTGVKFDAMQLPLDIELNDLSLANISVTQSKTSLLPVLSLQGELAASAQRIDISALNLSSEKGQLGVNGWLALQDNLPLNLQLSATADLSDYDPQLQRNTVESTIHGSLADLDIVLFLQSLTNAKATLSANLTDPDLPFSAQLDWEAFSYRNDDMTAEIHQGNLTASGITQRITSTVETGISATTVPSTLITASAVVAGNQINIQALDLELLDGTASLQGLLDLNAQPHFVGELTLSHVNPGLQWPDYVANINGTAVLEVSGLDNQGRITLPRFGFGGHFRDVPLAVGGDLVAALSGNIQQVNMELVNGSNLVSLHGQADVSSANGIINLNADIQADDLYHAQPYVGGQVSGSVAISNKVSAPKVNTDLRLSYLDSQWGFIDTLRLQGILDAAQVQDSQFRVEAENLTLQSVLIESVSASLNGSQQEHDFTIDMSAGDVQLYQRWQGEAEGSRWLGQLVEADVKTPAGKFSPDRTVLVDIDTSAPSATWSEHCWRAGQSAFCIAKSQFHQSQADWLVNATDIAFLPWANWLFTQNPIVDTLSTLSFSSSGKWQAENGIYATTELHFSPSTWTLNADNPLSVNVDELRANVLLDNDQVQLSSSLQGPLLGSLSSDITLTPAQDTYQTKGNVDIAQLDLALLAPLQKELDTLEGVLNGRLLVDGTLTRPNVNGQLSFDKGAIHHSPSKLVFSDIQSTLLFKGQALQLEGTFAHPDGVGDLAGSVSWQNAVTADMTLNADQLTFHFDPLVNATLSPHLSLGYRNNTLDINGDVVVDKAAFVIDSLPETAISPSADTVIIEEQQTKQEGLMVNLDINVMVDPQKLGSVSFDAFGLTTQVQGELALTQSQGLLNSNGQMSLNQGKFKAYGQNLLIREGMIQFNGPLEQPFLNVEAIRDPAYTNDNVIAGLRITGPAEEPEVTVFSEPDMAQDVALYYLLTGSSPGNQQSEESNVLLTNLLLSYGLKGSDSLSTRVGNSLGIENLQFTTTGQGEQTMLTVSGYLAPGLQVRYGVGVFDSAPEVALRYEWMPRLYLEAVSGISNALDLYYTFTRD
ncbi:translocation/assembly module TamB domain-containing protein [Aestuariibacter salexigens]|uniref:autotransporter assembly complex protein TamB n=1 Tax=Aestuariibacter salexigens TaxID=226010 RepID=UPI00041FFBAB|nr:translocation/assembly module TamB domain-containing protein [Aestuariibacter salexigens]